METDFVCRKGHCEASAIVRLSAYCDYLPGGEEEDGPITDKDV